MMKTACVRCGKLQEILYCMLCDYCYIKDSQKEESPKIFKPPHTLYRNEWDNRFIHLAKHIAQWSKDPSTKVGAVIVDDKKRIVGMGYNGFPRGIDDSPDRYNDKPTKYSMVVHAETNAILNAVKSVEGCTLYVWPLYPCNECAKIIIQAGIKNIISTNNRIEEYHVSKKLFDEAGINTETLIEVNENE